MRAERAIGCLRRISEAGTLRALARRWKKLAKKRKRPRQLDAAWRHKLRIRANKLRYAVEFFADVFPKKKQAKRCSAALPALKDLQDALGALNDVATREELMSRAALARRRRSQGSAARERAFVAGIVVGGQEAGVERLLDVGREGLHEAARGQAVLEMRNGGRCRD